MVDTEIRRAPIPRESGVNSETKLVNTILLKNSKKSFERHPQVTFRIRKSISPLETDWLFFGVNEPVEIQAMPSHSRES